MVENHIKKYREIAEAMNFDDFVDSLFDFARKKDGEVLSIQRADYHVTIIEVNHIDGKVFVRMDDVDMGFFEKYEQQGYKCRFNQKHRVRIHDGLLPNEALMKSICDNPLVLFHDA